MKKLQIVRVDNDLVEKADLQIGNNIIGRGAATGCDDSRIVKHAVTINLSPNDEMTITPVLPCYMKTTGSSKWQLLKLGSTVPIKPGDACSLLPDKCWFKVVRAGDTMEQTRDHALKRKAEEDKDECSVPDKKSCIDATGNNNIQSPSRILNEILNVHNAGDATEEQENNANDKSGSDNDNTKGTSNVPSCNSSVDDDNISASCSKLTSESQSTNRTNFVDENFDGHQNTNKPAAPSSPSKEIGWSAKTNLDEHTKNPKDSSVVIQEVQSPVPMQIDEPSASTVESTTVPNRDKCIYGKKCYRKNLQHRSKFTHPGDADYDIPDNRETCPYGTRCYRKNPQHRIQFKHVQTHKHSKRTAARVSKKTLSATEDSSADDSFEESVDESEYEPSSDVESSDNEVYFDKDESEWDDGTTG